MSGFWKLAIAALTLLGGGAGFIWLRYTQWKRLKGIRASGCSQCGYNLAGSPLRCPECGTVADAEARSMAARYRTTTFLGFLLSHHFVPDVPLNLSRFSDKARKVMALAAAVARHNFQSMITPRHLLGALCLERGGGAAAVLQRLGIDVEQLASQLATGTPAAPHDPLLSCPLTWQAHNICLAAVAEADFIGDNHVGTEHLLLALLAVPAESRIFFKTLTHEDALVALLAFRAQLAYLRGDHESALALCGMLESRQVPYIVNLKAWILAVSPNPRYRRAAEALTLAERAIELGGEDNPREAAFLDTLAAAQAANGNFSAAVESVKKAIACAAEHEKAEMTMRLGLYESSKPYIRP